LALVASGERLIAPDLVVAELCNAAWRLIRRGEPRKEQMPIIARGVSAAFAALYGSAELAPRAAAIALELDHPVYDCFYLALSEAQNAPMVSADGRLIAKAAAASSAARVVHLRELSPHR
jgi:predicted nucleic acid-binding protein